MQHRWKREKTKCIVKEINAHRQTRLLLNPELNIPHWTRNKENIRPDLLSVRAGKTKSVYIHNKGTTLLNLHENWHTTWRIRIVHKNYQLTLIKVLTDLKNKDVRKHLFVKNKFRYNFMPSYHFNFIHITGQHLNQKCMTIFSSNYGKCLQNSFQVH